MKTHFGPQPPAELFQENTEIDCQCARCGCSCDSSRCNECEDGVVWDRHGFDDEGGPAYTCPECNGDFISHWCLSSEEWCEANPLPGRESVRRGTIEWFAVKNQN